MPKPPPEVAPIIEVALVESVGIVNAASNVNPVLSAASRSALLADISIPTVFVFESFAKPITLYSMKSWVITCSPT